MLKNILLITAVILIAAWMLCGCKVKTKTLTDSASSTQNDETKINLYADFSKGSVDAETLRPIKQKEETVSKIFSSKD